MRTCQPDNRGRVNLGDLVSQGDTWAVASYSRDRIELVRLEPARRKPKRSLIEHCDRLRELGFELPPRDETPTRILDL